MSHIFTEDFRDHVAGLLAHAMTERLEEMVVDVDRHPRFGAMTAGERVEMRRLIQFELAKRPDSLVSRWLAIGGRVEYDAAFRLRLRGSEELADRVIANLCGDRR